MCNFVYVILILDIVIWPFLERKEKVNLFSSKLSVTASNNVRIADFNNDAAFSILV